MINLMNRYNFDQTISQVELVTLLNDVKDEKNI